ncbi:hypothetical protein C0995_005895, partial [Termitomyces sp. Mi166
GICKVKEINSNVGVELVWMSGHKGIRGNKCADTEAKKAAAGKETELRGLCFLQGTLPKSKAVIMMQHKKSWHALAETANAVAKVQESKSHQPKHAQDKNYSDHVGHITKEKCVIINPAVNGALPAEPLSS